MKTFSKELVDYVMDYVNVNVMSKEEKNLLTFCADLFTVELANDARSKISKVIPELLEQFEKDRGAYDSEGKKYCKILATIRTLCHYFEVNNIELAKDDFCKVFIICFFDLDAHVLQEICPN